MYKLGGRALNVRFVLPQMFIQLHKPKSTGEIISLERRLYEVVQKEWDSQEPTGHSFAQQTQKDVSTICFAFSSSFFVQSVGRDYK